MEDAKTFWGNVLVEIEKTITKQNYATWFKNTFLARTEDGILTIGVPNEFVKEWLSTKYHKDILRAARLGDEGVRGIEYIVAHEPKERSLSDIPTHPIGEIQKQTPSELPFGINTSRKDNLNPRYSFDTFIIGPFNELAYSAAQAIVKQPAAYNPLFIYGPTGLGKTHLIQSVGHALREKFPQINIFYTSSEKFTTDVVQAIQNNRISSLKERYRSYDVLIMDDIQFLSGKEKTQEELFHLFNILYDKNKQIIFSSDKHPNYIQGLEERLRSRFSAGMIVDVSKPEYESRMSILLAKASQQGIQISHDVLDFIAMHVEGNIRELEGILNTVVMQSELRGRPLDAAELKILIKNNIKPKKNVSIEDVIKIIARFYQLDESIIYEKTRRKEIVRCRQVAMYVLREDYNISFPIIGRKLGGRDHTTVMHSCDKVKTDMESDSGLVREVEQIRSMLTTA
jgi:chromosomal replication initiator protein